MGFRLAAPVMAMIVLALACAPVSEAPRASSVPNTEPTSQPALAATAAPPLTPTRVATATTAPTTAPTASRATAPTPTTATPTALPRQSLQEAVQAAVSRHQGTIGVVVTALNSGESFSLNADRRFRSASLYKLFILDTAEAEIERGDLDLGQTLTMTAAVAAADPYADLQIGTRISVDCALHSMIEMSGNSAADLLERRVGYAAVTAQLQALGLDHTVITSDVAVTSPGDVAQMLQSIARGEAINGVASQHMLDLLKAQQQNDRLPEPLPLSVQVAHKTGELPGSRHDAGIVLAPSGPYVLVSMVQDAPSESEARSAIVDISRAVYAALEPSGLPSYLGLAPRLARQVFRMPDAQGRLALLGDPRTETTTLPSEVATAAAADDSARVRPELLAELIALQHAADKAGVPFWVRSGFVQPTDAEASKALPIAWLEPCPIEQPARVADRPVADADVAVAYPRQAWLGTTITVTETQADEPGVADDRASATWKWLVAHGAEYGFVPALPESPDAHGIGHEPWTLRWVGRDMAVRLRPLDASDYAQRATAELARAEADLDAQDPRSKQPPAWGVADACWSIATWSGRGCASRWYFLGLPLS